MALRIKEIAKAKGITMGEIADKMGINPVNLSASLNGNPTLNRLQEVAAILGVEISDLFIQDSSYINGYIETGNNLYPVKSKEQLIGIIDKVDGIVQIPSCTRGKNLKENIEAFYYKSINNAESGAIMMRYGINEVFTLTYDSDHKRFSLTLCKGNSVIEFMTFDFAKYNQSDAPQSHHKNHLVDDIMDFIEDVYE
ncbi:MAG: helix-turn-helix transcriptional regulator [Bacteroidaceae bacterium]|nr:helix-turn-helix transcriptional regulator [Bacteroidaceae bacterium]